MKRVRRAGGYHGDSGIMRDVPLGSGLPAVSELAEELDMYRDVLLGREPAPVRGRLSLMEVADAYFARAGEMEMLILRAEREGKITRSSQLSRFRTGELRVFKEIAKSAAGLGSRRITALSLKFQQEKIGRESG